MDDTQHDIKELEAIMRNLFRSFKRSQYWTIVSQRADITMDRPAAILLHSIASNPSEKHHGQTLATRLGVEAPSITRKTQQLEREGYLVRVPDPKDRRAVSLEATAKGRAMSQRIANAQLSIMEDATQDWSAEDRQQFTKLFHRFSQDLTNIIK